ncbi:MAG TPA: hypothetical protein VIM51_07345 [Desulfosporosinus sp.]|jgi:hypothetical protein
MEKKVVFWADEQLIQKLSEIPKSEKSTVIRMALRQYFNMTNYNPVEPITMDTVQQMARELLRNLKALKRENADPL